jgi:FSR family fosmidomycin resistance protein-like MFS transporter
VAGLLFFAVTLMLRRWYKEHLHQAKARKAVQATRHLAPAGDDGAAGAGPLVFSKYFYMASFTSYFTFYDREVPAVGGQLPAAPVPVPWRGGRRHLLRRTDRRPYRRKAVIWFSILGVAPFTLALPYADLFWTTVLSVVIGFILASAFSAIVVYARNWCPGSDGDDRRDLLDADVRLRRHSARRLLGYVADLRGIEYVYGYARTCRCSGCWRCSAILK